MGLKTGISVAILVMGTILLVIWGRSQAQRGRSVFYDTAPEPRDDSAWILTGTLSPMATTSLDARNLELTVPLNSWVAKGQVIGAEPRAGPEQGPERPPVVSPSDGLLIATGLFPGTLGIASDPSRICVYTRVRPADMPSLRLGEQALIAVYSEPAATLHAKVSAIGVAPIDYSGDSAYPVTLVVEDPEGKRFSGASVQIQLLPGAR